MAKEDEKDSDSHGVIGTWEKDLRRKIKAKNVARTKFFQEIEEVCEARKKVKQDHIQENKIQKRSLQKPQSGRKRTKSDSSCEDEKPEKELMTKPAAKKRPPPSIVLRQKESWEHVRKLANNRIKYITAKNEIEGIRFFPMIFADYRRSVNFFTAFKYQYHTNTLAENLQRNLVLRGFHEHASIDKI